MNRFVRFCFLLFWVAVSAGGCGSSQDLAQVSGAPVGGGQPLEQQGFRVVLSAKEVELPTNQVVSQAETDKLIKVLYVADAQRRVVAQKNFDPVDPIDWTFSDLPVGTYEVGVMYFLNGRKLRTGSFLAQETVVANQIRVLGITNFDLVADLEPPKNLALDTSSGLITVGPDISAVHIIGESPCPQLVGNLAIGNNTDQQVDIKITIASPLYIDSPTTFTLAGNVGAALLDVYFDCSTQQSFTQVITIQATSADGTAETKTVNVSVEIRLP